MKQPEHSSRRLYHVAWTIVAHCFMVCLPATSGKSSLSRMPPLGFSLELDEGTTSRQCCASCTGFQSSDESTSNWHVLFCSSKRTVQVNILYTCCSQSHMLSSRHCLTRHLRTWMTTYIWFRKGLDASSARLRQIVCCSTHTQHIR